jgi:hypothetical protein
MSWNSSSSWEDQPYSEEYGEEGDWNLLGGWGGFGSDGNPNAMCSSLGLLFSILVIATLGMVTFLLVRNKEKDLTDARDKLVKKDEKIGNLEEERQEKNNERDEIESKSREYKGKSRQK